MPSSVYPVSAVRNNTFVFFVGYLNDDGSVTIARSEDYVMLHFAYGHLISSALVNKKAVVVVMQS